jgi:hypothetical protein
MKNNLVKILGTFGLIIAIALILKGVFGVGEIGLKKIKTNTNKIIKKSTNKNLKTDYIFTCEGRAQASVAGIGLGSEHNTNDLFIDEYNLRKTKGINDRNKDVYFLQMSNSTMPYGRPYQIFEENRGELTINNSTINFNPSFSLGLNNSVDFKMQSYSGTISLHTGTFSATLVKIYKKTGGPVPVQFTGKCFGLEQIGSYIN